MELISYFRSDPILPEDWNSVPLDEPARVRQARHLIHLAMSAHRLSTLPSEVQVRDSGAHGGVPSWHTRHIATSPHCLISTDLQTCRLTEVRWRRAEVQDMQRCRGAHSQVLPREAGFQEPCDPGLQVRNVRTAFGTASNVGFQSSRLTQQLAMLAAPTVPRDAGSGRLIWVDLDVASCHLLLFDKDPAVRDRGLLSASQTSHPPLQDPPGPRRKLRRLR